jgi:mono/diheme cytochrome c family protein
MFYRMLGMVALAASMPHIALAQQAATANPTQSQSSLDVPQLFAGTCGWCHSDGGRAPGKGPQLMNTQRSDDFIRTRIKIGKEGAMPAFGKSFSDADIDAIIKYIRSLKPQQG